MVEGTPVPLSGTRILTTRIGLAISGQCYHINVMNAENRYNYIVHLINQEIDEIVEESFPDSGYDSKERYRDEQLANYLHFMIKDLQSDNA